MRESLNPAVAKVLKHMHHRLDVYSSYWRTRRPGEKSAERPLCIENSVQRRPRELGVILRQQHFEVLDRIGLKLPFAGFVSVCQQLP